MSPFKYSISLLLLTLSTLGSTIQAQELDLVLLGGRVMDPETGLDAIRNVGIADGTVAIITEDDIRGRETIDATGLVVAPGFIDLHAHGQDPVSNRLQAADGVTTALEMEVGVYPVGEWLASREGTALIHYGATAGHWPARAAMMDAVALKHLPTLPAGRTGGAQQGRARLPRRHRGGNRSAQRHAYGRSQRGRARTRLWSYVHSGRVAAGVLPALSACSEARRSCLCKPLTYC